MNLSANTDAPLDRNDSYRLREHGAQRSGSGGGRRARDESELHEDIFVPFDSKMFERLWEFARPYRAALAACIAVVVFYALVQVAIPLAIRFTVDSAVAKLQGGAAALSLSTAVALFGGLVLLNFATSFLQEWGAARVAQRVIFNLRRAMFAHLQNVSLALLEQTQVGRLMARLQGDVGALQEFMESSFSALGDLMLLIGIVVVLLVMDWQLGLLTLATLPALVLVRVLWLPWARSKFRRARESSSRTNSVLAENINGIRTVQESCRETLNFERYERVAHDNLQAQTDSSLASQLMVPVVDILTGIAMAIVVIVGGAAVLNGHTAVGVMVAYLFYVQRFFDPIRTLSMQYTVLQRAMAAGHRIFEVLDLPITLADRPGAGQLRDVEPAIEFRRVTFGYKPDQPVLHDLQLTIAPYTTVALVGATGSGKTTITALLHRFYDVWDGQVLIGDRDVRELGLEALGKGIGMVLQEPFLFSGTIMDNLRYGLRDATDAAVIAAARAVSAHDFIMRLPLGYQTPLGQRGRNLSIGQRQLLSFARTLLLDPRILVLDEATANIDSFTELAIQKALKVLSAGRTCIIVAHRLATIRDADQIVVLSHGRIVEQGTHTELLARQGMYHRLSNSSHGSLGEPAV
jgi:ATP-binding cassette, subfamily B, multidrug efflux pump